MEPSPFPNRVTNLVVAVVVGILLASLQIRAWPFYALLAAIGISLSHIVANSSQYAQFDALQSSPNERKLEFVLLKSSVSLIEIIVIYLIANAIIT